MIDPWRKLLAAIAEHPDAATRGRMVAELYAQRDRHAGERLQTWVDVMVRLGGETDSVIADLVAQNLMNYEPLGTPKSELLHQVIVRLRRAAGGPMPDEEEDDAPTGG